LTEVAFVSRNASTLSIDTLAVTVTVGHFTFIMSQTAFFPLPSRIALALPIHVVPSTRAKDWADTLAAVICPESRIALAVTQLALTVSGTAVRAALSHFLRYVGIEDNLLGIRVIVVQGEEPMPRFQKLTCLL
jgi:hypothetical protein